MKIKLLFYYLAGLALFVIAISSLIFLSWNLVLQILGTAGGWVLLGIFLAHLFYNIPHFQSIASYIARAFSFLRIAELASVKLDLESNLNSSKGIINEEIEGMMPYRARVDWVKEETPESFLDKYKGEVIIRMRPHKYQARNLTYATIDYVSKGLIPFSRIYLDAKISRSIDFTMVKKLLMKQKRSAALDCFLTEVVKPEMIDQQLREHIIALETIDKKGLFTRMLLRELREIGRLYYPKYDQQVTDDTKTFVQYLKTLAEKKPGEIIQLVHPGKKLKVTSILIAIPEKFAMYGSEPYVNAAKYALSQGVNSIYVLGLGLNVIAARKVVEEIGKIPELEKVGGTEKEFTIEGETGKALKSVCALFRRTFSSF